MSDPLRPVFTGVPSGGASARAVIIGASAGGPKALEGVLRALPADFPAPIAVCQHMLAGWTRGWAERLDGHCALHVCEARHRQPFEPGSIYIAPAGRHMRLQGAGRAVTIQLTPDFADSLFVPSIDYLMSSAATTYGSRLLAVLLTGLMSDGAIGMLAVRRAGGHTIAQSEDTSAAASMPRAAMELGAAAESVPLDRIAAAMIESVSRG